MLKKLQPYVRRNFVAVKPYLQKTIHSDNANGEKQVTFLSGFARSGTNMVMEVFEWTLKTEVFRERDPRLYDNFELCDEATILRQVAASPARYVIVKAVLDGHRLAGLMDLFPGSGAMWMYRHYDDCVNSILQHWPGHRNGIDEIVESGPDAAGWRGRNMTDETLAQLRAEYEPGWNDATCNAWFWYLRHQSFYDQDFDTSPRAVLVRYESLVTEPLRVIGPLADLAGVKMTSLMASVPHARSVRKKPAADIAPKVRERCEAMLARLDATWQAEGI